AGALADKLQAVGAGTSAAQDVATSGGMAKPSNVEPPAKKGGFPIGLAACVLLLLGGGGAAYYATSGFKDFSFGQGGSGVGPANPSVGTADISKPPELKPDLSKVPDSKSDASKPPGPKADFGKVSEKKPDGGKS